MRRASCETTAASLAPADAVHLLMSRPPAAVEAVESVRSVAQELIAGDVGALLVEATGAPAGLVSERDVLVTAAPRDRIAAVGALMRDAGVRHIPVRDVDGRWVGLVSIRDVDRD
jgi:CBS domain-containing protein